MAGRWGRLTPSSNSRETATASSSKRHFPARLLVRKQIWHAPRSSSTFNVRRRRRQRRQRGSTLPDTLKSGAGSEGRYFATKEWGVIVSQASNRNSWLHYQLVYTPIVDLADNWAWYRFSICRCDIRMNLQHTITFSKMGLGIFIVTCIVVVVAFLRKQIPAWSTVDTNDERQTVNSRQLLAVHGRGGRRGRSLTCKSCSATTVLPALIGTRNANAETSYGKYGKYFWKSKTFR